MKTKKYSSRLAILLLSCFLLAFSFEVINLASFFLGAAFLLTGSAI